MNIFNIFIYNAVLGTQNTIYLSYFIHVLVILSRFEFLFVCFCRFNSSRVSQEPQISESEVVVFSVPSYACQRRTALDNHNTTLTVRQQTATSDTR